MLITQKTRYALRGLFQLATGRDRKPVKVSSLAEAQQIPARFLEVIFAELKQGGIVESRRGNEGGYLLAKPPEAITVGEVIRFIQGENTAEGSRDNSEADRSVFGDFAFGKLWADVSNSVSAVCDTRTLADLVEKEIESREKYVPNYTI
jgi:Rrf2 family protein